MEGENKMTKVLIVDDSEFMRVRLRKILEDNSFEVVGEAENGVIGIKKYLEYQPDIVTMDITMPEMSGIDALKAIRKLNPQAKVVMISALGQEFHVKEAVVYGAKTFIVKPFKEERVIEALNKIAAT